MSEQAHLLPMIQIITYSNISERPKLGPPSRDYANICSF